MAVASGGVDYAQIVLPYDIDGDGDVDVLYAGYHTIRWDARNDMGESISAGMYIYTIQAVEFRSSKKMVLLK